ncbi:pentatricopeptide repeat-containing protein, partial [Trifolium pratense]
RWSVDNGNNIKVMHDPWLRGTNGAWLPSPQDQVNVVSQQADWHKLWSISAPLKAKHLLWRISKGCLPTCMRLQEKHVPCPLLCPVCNQHNEDDWHVLFECETSIQARQSAGLVHTIESRLQQNTNASQIIHMICSTEDKTTAGMFAMLVWTLWNNRNNLSLE